jgi:hypothetical protein
MVTINSFGKRGVHMELKKEKIVETIEMPEGLSVDLDEGWPKVDSRQYGDDEGRGYKEVIQNLIDSHPENTPWDERTGEILAVKKCIWATDDGEGFSLDRIKILLTLGATDKFDNIHKIGQFGIGFYSVFNPRLGTQKVVVTTRCEGEVVELTFEVFDPKKRPRISSRILEENITFSTRIEIHFNRESSVKKCLQHARKCLEYYPCRVSVNGKLVESVWERAKNDSLHHFENGACRGFLKETHSYDSIAVLARYEHIIDMSPRMFITGGHDVTHDLRDFAEKEVPFLNNVGAVINSMTLRVTIGRDGFYMGPPYREMVRTLARVFLCKLGERIKENPNTELILANQYILRKSIRTYMEDGLATKKMKMNNSQEDAIKQLAEAKIFRVKGRKREYSLLDLKELQSSSDVPFYHCINQHNANWLGGDFKHNFIVLSPAAGMGGGAPDFHETLFSTFFEDTIDLDQIAEDQAKIKELVSRGIVDESSLTPEIRFKGKRDLSREELGLQDEMDEILALDGVRSAIAKHLHLHAVSIRSTLFVMDESGVVVSSGLFNRDGEPLTKNMISNFMGHQDKDDTVPGPWTEVELLVGVNSGNPLIEILLGNNKPHRAYYALTLLANELTRSQRLLTPRIPFFHVVKDRLANDMRKAMLDRLVPESHDQEAVK